MCCFFQRLHCISLKPPTPTRATSQHPLFSSVPHSHYQCGPRKFNCSLILTRANLASAMFHSQAKGQKGGTFKWALAWTHGHLLCTLQAFNTNQYTYCLITPIVPVSSSFSGQRLALFTRDQNNVGQAQANWLEPQYSKWQNVNRTLEADIQCLKYVMFCRSVSIVVYSACLLVMCAKSQSTDIHV